MTLKERAHRLLDEARAVSLAVRDPRTPRSTRILALAVLAYAASPIDLVPDFIPVLGHLDDLVIVPLGLALAIRRIPPQVLAEAREEVRRGREGACPRGHLAAAVVVAIWLLLAAAAIVLLV